jgi:hypothetical protein
MKNALEPFSVCDTVTGPGDEAAKLYCAVLQEVPNDGLARDNAANHVQVTQGS